MDSRARSALLCSTLAASAGVGLLVPDSGCILSDHCIKIEHPGSDFCNYMEDALMWPPGQPEAAEPVPPTVGSPGPEGCVCFNAEEESTLESKLPLAYLAELDARVTKATRQACAVAVPEGWDHNCFEVDTEGAPDLAALYPYYSGAGACVGDCSYINPPKKGSCPDENPYEYQGAEEPGADDEADGGTDGGSGDEADSDSDSDSGVGELDVADYVACWGMTCEVDRNYARALVEDLAWSGGGETRFVFDGAASRFVLQGVGPGSLAGALGLLDGDRVESVNGAVIDGVEAALGALADNRDAQVIQVEIVREPQRLSFSYALVD